VRYPKERVLAEFPRYFTSHAAWMIALALTEGVTHLGFFGIHYALDEEHKKQRSGCEFWMGVAIGRGVQIVNPPGSPLMREPGWLYGYESHEGKQHIRTTTGGKKPGRVDLSVPPQNKTFLTDPALVAANIDKVRQAATWNDEAEECRAAQVEGRAPVLNGKPLWMIVFWLNCQPPRMRSTARELSVRNALPRPTGISVTVDSVKVWVRSKFAVPRLTLGSMICGFWCACAGRAGWSGARRDEISCSV
jgi:hypothetical protein